MAYSVNDMNLCGKFGKKWLTLVLSYNIINNCDVEENAEATAPEEAFCYQMSSEMKRYSC